MEKVAQDMAHLAELLKVHKSVPIHHMQNYYSEEHVKSLSQTTWEQEMKYSLSYKTDEGTDSEEPTLELRDSQYYLTQSFATLDEVYLWLCNHSWFHLGKNSISLTDHYLVNHLGKSQMVSLTRLKEQIERNQKKED